MPREHLKIEVCGIGKYRVAWDTSSIGETCKNAIEQAHRLSDLKIESTTKDSLGQPATIITQMHLDPDDTSQYLIISFSSANDELRLAREFQRCLQMMKLGMTQSLSIDIENTPMEVKCNYPF